MYTIKIEYQTGNSFGHEDAESEIGYEFETKEEARLVLGYLKEHHELYKKLNSCYKPLEKQKIIKEYQDKPWFSEKYTELCLLYKDRSISAFWHGYFETLRCATVIISQKEESLDVYYP